MGSKPTKPVNPPSPVPPEEDPVMIQQLLNEAVTDFQQSTDLQTALPLFHLVRIKVNDPTNALILTVDDNNKPVFYSSVPNNMLENSIFFKITFQHQPGAQYEHCFITSKRQHILFIQTGLVHAEAVTNGQVSNHSIQQSRYYFYHSPDSGSSEPPSNCSLHPAGTTACSLEYNNNGDAIMGCLSMKMDIQMLGHIDSANNWQTTVSSQQ